MISVPDLSLISDDRSELGNQSVTPLDWDLGALAEGLECYRQHKFFLAHEHWESEWIKSQEPEKTFLQALIQIAAAFHHLQRGNFAGAASLLLAARRKLEPYPPDFGGMAIAPLRKSIGEWLQALQMENPPPEIPFPQIR